MLRAKDAPVRMSEEQREALVRKVPCPVCKVAAGRVCDCEGGGHLLISHTGRYNRAASVGLVPKLPGVRRG